MAAAVVDASPSTYTYSYNRWFLGGPAFWGNLTFNGGQGGIAWTPEPASQDGPTDATVAQVYGADQSSRYYTGASAVPVSPPDYVFRSAPLPQTLYLNATHNIQLELYLSDSEKTNPCPYSFTSSVQDPNLEVRLRIGDQILGGMMADDYHLNYVSWFYYGPPYTGPAPPSGWSICRFAFASERHILDAGTVLTLEINIVDQKRPYQIGASGDHRSNLKFITLPPDDVLFRFPELAPPEEEPEPDVLMQPGALGASTSGTLGLPLLAVGGIAGLTVGRPARRTLAVLLAVLLVAVAASGCLTTRSREKSTPSESLEGKVENTYVKGDGSLATGSLGAIVGRVQDDLHLPVGGVHVSILGLANFTQTDGKGYFKFLNMLPGAYKLRFDKKEYKSFEADIEVRPGLVSRPQVTMLLANLKDRDARQHSHDYWAPGQTQKTVMDQALATTCTYASTARCDFQPYVRIPSKPGEVNTVLPGTRNVEVVLDWDPAQIGWSRLGLIVRHNGDAYALNQSVYAPRGPGVPFQIATTWEMADAGHQAASTWEFQVYKGGAYSRYGYVEGWMGYADTALPQIKMKVVITKGALPLESGHPDRWGDLTRLDISKNVISYWYNCTTPKAVEPTLRCYDAWTARAYPSKVIPQGTGELEVKVTWNRAPSFPVKLLMKPANVPASRDLYSFEAYREVGVADPGSTMTWKFKIKAEEADPEYAKASQVQFAIQAADYNLAYADYLVSLSNLGQVQPYLQPTVSIVAHRA